MTWRPQSRTQLVRVDLVKWRTGKEETHWSVTSQVDIEFIMRSNSRGAFYHRALSSTALRKGTAQAAPLSSNNIPTEPYSFLITHSTLPKLEGNQNHHSITITKAMMRWDTNELMKQTGSESATRLIDQTSREMKWMKRRDTHSANWRIPCSWRLPLFQSERTWTAWKDNN